MQNLKLILRLGPQTSAKQLNYLRIWLSHSNSYSLESFTTNIYTKSILKPQNKTNGIYSS